MIDAQFGNRAPARVKLSRALKRNPYFSLLWSGTARGVLASLGEWGRSG